MKNSKKGAIGANTPYKAILFNGIDEVGIADDIEKAYGQEGYLLINYDIKNIDKLDLSVLKGKVDNNTRIDISTHGIASDGVHNIGIKTRDFLRKIASYSGDVPLNIHLHSCYAGAAAADVDVLPEGSVLVTHGTPYNMTSVNINNKTILNSIQDLKITDSVHDFITRFALNVKQTATISIKKADGIFQHTIRPPQHMLSTPHEVARYLELERSEFIQAYDRTQILKPPTIKPPAITTEEAIEWRNDNFFSMAVANDDKELIEALSDRIEAFADYINYSADGNTALMLAVRNRDIKLAAAILAAPSVDVNAKDKDGCTALMLAVLHRDIKLVSILLAVPSIDVNIKDKDGCTALMKAAEYGYDDVVTAFINSGKVDLDEAKVNLLISDQAMKAYRTGKVTVQDLRDLDETRVSWLISYEATIAYDTGRITVEDLLAEDNIGIGRNILKAYAEYIGKETKESLGYIDNLQEEAQIETLLSEQARAACHTGKVTIKDLLAEDNIGIGRNILKAYAEHIGKETKESLGYIDNLQDIAKITVLLSKEARAAYETGKVTVQDLLAEDIIGIKRNILKAYAEYIYREERESLSYIDNLQDEAKIELLLSEQVRAVYHTGMVAARDLMDLDEAKIKLLISEQLRTVYSTGMVAARDLMDVDEAKIKLLISALAQKAYKTGRVTVQDLKYLDEAKIKLLISSQAQNAYNTPKVMAKDLTDLDEAKIKLLISNQAIAAYKTGKVTVQDLRDLDETKIKLLISYRAIAAYRTGKVTVQDLKYLDEAKIKLLISDQAMETYKSWNAEGTNFSAKDVVLINSLSDSIGAQLLKAGTKYDVEFIKSTLMDVVNTIKSYNPKFEVASLDPGEVGHGFVGKIKENEGLSRMFHSYYSHTAAGQLAGVEKNAIAPLKKQLEDYIKKSSMKEQADARTYR